VFVTQREPGTGQGSGIEPHTLGVCSLRRFPTSWAGPGDGSSIRAACPHAGLAGFRCTGRLGSLRTDVLEPPRIRAESVGPLMLAAPRMTERAKRTWAWQAMISSHSSNVDSILSRRTELVEWAEDLVEPSIDPEILR
jgi:hypothetical protein